MREWCKGDDASQWGNGKFDPLPRPNPLTDRHQNLHTWLLSGYLPHAKFSHDPLRCYFSPYTRNCAPKMFTWLLLWVLPTPYSLGLQIDFHAQCVKRRGSAQGCAFSVLENQNLTFKPSYPPKKKRHLWARFWLDLENFRLKTALQWGMFHVNSLIVIVVPYKSYKTRHFDIFDFKHAGTLKTGLGVLQGHCKCHQSIERIWLPINVP